MITYMKLQKLVDAGAFTMGGDVILLHPRLNRQVVVAHRVGGDECELTAAGEEMRETFEPKPEVKGFTRPRKATMGLADVLGDE